MNFEATLSQLGQNSFLIALAIISLARPVQRCARRAAI